MEGVESEVAAAAVSAAAEIEKEEDEYLMKEGLERKTERDLRVVRKATTKGRDFTRRDDIFAVSSSTPTYLF